MTDRLAQHQAESTVEVSHQLSSKFRMFQSLSMLNDQDTDNYAERTMVAGEDFEAELVDAIQKGYTPRFLIDLNVLRDIYPKHFETAMKFGDVVGGRYLRLICGDIAKETMPRERQVRVAVTAVRGGVSFKFGRPFENNQSLIMDCNDIHEVYCA